MNEKILAFLKLIADDNGWEYRDVLGPNHVPLVVESIWIGYEDIQEDAIELLEELANED